LADERDRDCCCREVESSGEGERAGKIETADEVEAGKENADCRAEGVGRVQPRQYCTGTKCPSPQDPGADERKSCAEQNRLRENQAGREQPFDGGLRAGRRDEGGKDRVIRGGRHHPERRMKE
jgi:hypothetical protein